MFLQRTISPERVSFDQCDQHTFGQYFAEQTMVLKIAISPERSEHNQTRQD